MKKNKFLKQHLSYLENITDFKQLNYEFDVKKFSDRNEIVNQFKKMYEKNTEKVFEVIWSNKNLRNSIFDMTSYPSNINDIQLKTIILSEYRIMISNADIRLFNFIKTN